MKVNVAFPRPFLAVLLALTVSACGGASSGPSSPPGPAGSPDQQAAAGQQGGAAEQGAAAGQGAAAQGAASGANAEAGAVSPSQGAGVPRPVVYGVDLDTIQAGRFDQGKMWTFEFPPVEYLAETYGLRPDEAWFEKARMGALRIPNCSASFVSPNGLVMTNHHCAREFVTQVSAPGENLLDNGLVATDLADERTLEDFQADKLMTIVDVTDEVNAALDALPADERAEARESLLEEIEARILAEHGGEESGHVVEMVSLYNGGRTSAYVFRRYTNGKLVMAPELEIGFFGGEPDNFSYPRYNLDFAFLRIYDDDGTPLRSDPYFAFDDDGLEPGDPVFIVGNPGSTSRLQTVAELEFRRDVSDRYILHLLESRLEVMGAYIEANPEIAEELDLRNTYFGLSNSLEAYTGQVRGLEDPIIIARRRDTERDFQAAIEADPQLAERYGDVIAEMAALQARKREQAPGFGAFLAMTSPQMASATLHRALIAFQILSARQGGAPADQVEPLMEQLRAVPDQPVELDQGLMAARFRDFVEFYGADSQLARSVLAGQTPEARARAVASGSQLQDSATAVQAVEGGSLTLADPALGVVRAYLPQFIAFQQVVGAVFPQEEALAAELGRARFAVYGTDVPPDATFSLRIADGAVTGYDYNGTEAPPFTTLYGLYDRHYSFSPREDWDLPQRWLDAEDELDLATPINFVSTADIIGGNSGSPVLDAELEVVGVVFDGNAESLPGDYIYLPERNRSVTVDARAIVEALDVVYDMDRLVLELLTGRLVETEAEADRAGSPR
ncbi:MAG: S46 family peptidase [Longimicrobiales bacterium]|nr:S46 family peptidase [Longimicrobiales bacterium]